MDSEIVTVDQFAAAMASIQEAIANLGQKIDGQQTQQVSVQEDTQFDTTVPSPPLPMPTPISKDPHARMDRLEQKLRQMGTSEGAITWEDFDGAPVASLPAKFRMPEIERYTGIGCPRIHLRLYNTVMRAHGLDEAQMVMLFPMSLSGAVQRWFASLEALYGIEEGIARGLWSESSPTDSKGKKPSGGQRSGDVGAISSAGMRPPRHYQTVRQTLGFYYPLSPHAHYRPPTPSKPMTPTYLHPVSQPVFAAHVTERPPALYTRPRAPQTTTYVQRPPCQFAQLVSPSPGDIHHMDLIEDDSIHMLSWDNGLPESIVLHDSYEVDGVLVVPQVPTPFSLIPDDTPFQLTHLTPLVIGCQDDFVPFTLWQEDDDSEGREVQIVTRSGRIAQPPPPAVRPFEDDDLPPDGLDHVRPLYITVGCSGRKVPSVLLDNGSALNVCPLATTIALGFAPSDFGPSTQTVRAYDSTKREVMGTLMIDLRIGPATFSILFQILRIPTSFNLLLGRPWIHIAGAIPFSLHQKCGLPGIYLPLLSQYFRSHSEDDLLLTGFTFDEVQTLEIGDFCRDFVAMSFDQHSSTVVLDMMRGRRQQGPSEFIAAIDHDTTFGLGFIPTEADYRYMARLRKERVRARLFHTPFDYPIRPYRMSLTDYFVKGSEIRPRPEEIDSVVHIDRETELQHLFHQLQLSDGAPGTSVSMSTPMSPDRASMLSLCFPKEITDDGIFDIDDEIAQPSSDRDSFDHDSDPIDERVLLAIWGVETVDFGTEDQLRELKIGSPLSTDEKDRLIHLLRSYLDVFAWSYEDMPGYNQILMAPEDMEKTTFITEWGTYCYRVMPFGLKNVGATYQRAATTLFHDMTHRDVEVYVDGMIVKSRGRADHLDALERFFERIRKFRLRLNPKKCTFGVTSGKLLGHMVSEPGIEVDPDKIKAILDMPAPKTEKEIRSFLGRLQYINRFIARLTDICEPIFRLLRKNQPKIWNDDCQLAFEKIKEYLLSPPVLVPPTPGRPLLLYLSVSDMALGCMLAQMDDLGKELMRWLVLLTEFDIQYVSQKSIKGSMVVDHLASLPTSEDRPVDDDFPDEEFVAMTSLSRWCLYFDGAANQLGYGIGVLLVSPQGDHIPRSVRLAFHDRHPITNNIVEYEACILGLETALELGIRQMEVSPKSSSGHEFILVAIDYFTKWVEAASYARLTSGRVASFIRSHIIFRYGVPHELISDRGVHFQAEVDTLLQKYAIRHHRSSAYRPQTNGAVKAVNKNIKRILRKMVETSRDWSEKLPFALWAYRTFFRTSTGATPYSLVYGMEAVLPVKTEMGSLRVALKQQIFETEWAQARCDQLNLLDERRLRVADHVQAYQRKMTHAFKK
uniref:Integrase catalytic domain-containing protein n=1 Tax=Vitis vinifera TaxID=29760 RepID=A5AZA3_VITVI|nr:hypothetical protein VITISV_033525 [Vitis vinifera]